MPKLKFVPWVLSKRWTGPESDLKEDLKRDIKSYGFTGTTYQELENHMYSMRACWQALEVVKKMYQLYKKSA